METNTRGRDTSAWSSFPTVPGTFTVVKLSSFFMVINMSADLDRSFKRYNLNSLRRFIAYTSHAGVDPDLKRTGLALCRFVNKK